MYSTLRGIRERYRSELKEIYSQREVDQLFSRCVEEYTGKNRAQQVLDADLELDASTLEQFENTLNRLLKSEPVQYILGKSDFFGLSFQVNRNVLIPRPETEELVQLVLDENGEEQVTVLDIGTGSGIIPVTLKKHRPKWNVYACDVDQNALSVARSNGTSIVGEESVEFYQEDILQPKRSFEHLNIIVSNPPYVLRSDQGLMERNVLEFEPHLALFVEDDDPLLFYRFITDYAIKNLSDSGKLYFEVHEDLADEVVELLKMNDFNAESVRDLQGKQRMVKARK